MKAIILAAGLGSRLGKYTEEIPKTLLPIGGKPLIFYTLENLSSLSIRDIIILTGHAKERIRDLLGDGRDYNLFINYINNPIFNSTNNIYTLLLGLDILAREDFIIINSDTFFHPKILERLVNSEKSGLILSIDDKKLLGEEEMKVIIDDYLVKDISKELNPIESTGEYIGLSRVDSYMFNKLYDTTKQVINEEGTGVFYEEVFKRLIKDGIPINYSSTGGLPWIEIDTPTDLNRAQELVNDLEFSDEQRSSKTRFKCI